MWEYDVEVNFIIGRINIEISVKSTSFCLLKFADALREHLFLLFYPTAQSEIFNRFNLFLNLFKINGCKLNDNFAFVTANCGFKME